MNEEEITVCKWCFEEIETKWYGDEGWSWCPGCEMIEPDTIDITEEEYEKRLNK